MQNIAEEGKYRDNHQKDIEEEFKIRKSSVSSVMNMMEKNGLIIRMTSTDERCKKIILSAKGKTLQEKIYEDIEKFDTDFKNALNEAEQKEFLRMVSILSQYLENK